MKRFSTLVIQLAMTSVLLSASFGCSVSDQAAEARTQAMDERAGVADANARVTAADAHVKAAEAVARVHALAARQGEHKAGGKGVIPSGTILKVFLIDAIDSKTSSPGDHFLASLAESVVIKGVTVLPRGTRVRGRVIHAEGAGKEVKGHALIHLDLTDIVPGNSRAVAITTKVFEEHEIHYDPETRLDFTLTSPVTL